MAKKALFNFYSDGRNFEKGKSYEDADCANVDVTNFEASTEETVKPVEGVIGTEEVKEETLPEEILNSENNTDIAEAILS